MTEEPAIEIRVRLGRAHQSSVSGPLVRVAFRAALQAGFLSEFRRGVDRSIADREFSGSFDYAFDHLALVEISEAEPRAPEVCHPDFVLVGTDATVQDVYNFYGADLVDDSAPLQIRPGGGYGGNEGPVYIAIGAAYFAFETWGYFTQSRSLIRWIISVKNYGLISDAERYAVGDPLSDRLRNYLVARESWDLRELGATFRREQPLLAEMLRESGFRRLGSPARYWVKQTEDWPP